MKLLYRLQTIDGDLVQLNPDGSVVSVQPNAAIDSRPAGTHGAYEKCQRDGAMLLYTPDVNGPTFLFGPE